MKEHVVAGHENPLGAPSQRGFDASVPAGGQGWRLGLQLGPVHDEELQDVDRLQAVESLKKKVRTAVVDEDHSQPYPIHAAPPIADPNPRTPRRRPTNWSVPRDPAFRCSLCDLRVRLPSVTGRGPGATG